MTAITTSRPDAAGASAGLGMLPGFGGLLRKELTEWRRDNYTYEALMSSVYVRRDGEWKLALHQQTPVTP